MVIALASLPCDTAIHITSLLELSKIVLLSLFSALIAFVSLLYCPCQSDAI